MGRRAAPPARIDIVARAVVFILLKHGKPSLGEVAAAEGVSPRTLQRRLAEHGASFSALLQEVRKAEALQWLSAGNQPLCHLAQDLGYAQPSTLTRAVRRWTGFSPSRLRSRSERATSLPAVDDGTGNND